MVDVGECDVINDVLDVVWIEPRGQERAGGMSRVGAGVRLIRMNLGISKC